MTCYTKPVTFKRGSTFAFMFQIPAEVPAGFFRNWVPKAQLRKARSSTAKGLIADLECYWNDPTTGRHIIVRQLTTDDFPLGDAELDIRLESATGETIQTATIPFVIARGITHGQH
ncbi:MAG: hypothetical protein [Podoviridae sp. ctda_1]|nr:MAG: hypothetical protein [Podoviridae sp. ctda_1]